MTSAAVDGEVNPLPKSKIDISTWRIGRSQSTTIRIHDLSSFGLFFRMEMRGREASLH